MLSLDVAIVLCTYQGASFLKEQLASYEAQTHTHWRLYASDDGSTDGTVEILQAFQNRLGTDKVFIFSGPQQGHAAHFLHVLGRNITEPWVALSDQDDIWFPDKLSRALKSLPREETIPCLYGSRTQLVDAHNKHMGYSSHFKKKPCFQNALVQSLAGGNTMVFNQPLRRLFLRTQPDQIHAHDWMLYQLATASGGFVFYDTTPSLRYRQHGNNAVGHNLGIQAKWKRIQHVLRGDYRLWNQKHMDALLKLQEHFEPEAQKLIQQFHDLRTQSGFRAWRHWKQLGLHRQKCLDNWVFRAMACLDKL